MDCENCHLPFNTTIKRPIVSDCGHTICEKCRVQLEKCPECQVQMDKTKWTVNHTIVKLVENKKKEVDMLVSICIVGQSSVGKSCLMLRLVKSEFLEQLANTIGLDYRLVNMEIDGLNYRFQIWDTAGQEKFHTIFTSIYKTADVMIIVADATKDYEFEKYQQIIQEQCTNKNVPKIYVVNKIDLLSPKERSQDYHYLSCKTNEGVNELWDTIIQIALLIPKESISFNTKTQRMVLDKKKKNNPYRRSKSELNFANNNNKCC